MSVQARQFAVVTLLSSTPASVPIHVRQLAVVSLVRAVEVERVLKIGQVTYLSSKNVQVIYE